MVVDNEVVWFVVGFVSPVRLNLYCFAAVAADGVAEVASLAVADAYLINY